MEKSFSESYKQAGVDITAGYRAVELMKKHIARTVTPGAASDIGGFGGLFELDLTGMTRPVLVSGTDGVGTKLKYAFMLDKHDTIGIDCVADVVNNSVTYLSNYITVNKGRKDGVEPDMGVVSERGVVGIVSTVSDHFSVVIPLLNPKFKLSCKVLGSSYFGTLSWNGRNARFANLDELPRHVEFEKGDTIVTSGYSAIFPSGIIVGKVVNFEKQHDDNFYSLEVELATDFQALNNVRIIKNYHQAEQKNTEREAKKND